MKKVLLTTTAIVGLSAPAFAADPTAVSDQPYFHHSHPMTWTGSMSIALTNFQHKMQTMLQKSLSKETGYLVKHLTQVPSSRWSVGSKRRKDAIGISNRCK